MKELKDMTFGFVGLGLMGGSIAKGIKDKVFKANYSLGKNGFENDSNGKIYAMDKNINSLNQALEDKIIDKAFTPDQTNEMLNSCDFVFICLYPKATLNFLIEHKDSFKPGSVVTDISGVKTLIAENIFAGEKSIIRSDVDFILGHPMAGNEKEGYSGSNQCIFEGRNYILMPQSTNKSETISLMKELVTKLGIKRIIETDYITHDHKIAFTSQLCHVIASALVDSAEDNKITAFGGGSYEDLTRIALINAPLWTELFLSNKKELLSMISTFESSLSNIKKAIENEDQDGLQKILTCVRTKRAEMQKI
ncbi:MAG: prephenate dehydrogenase [Treponema sp.]|uniref:prephenate dehydrogenase n=1 Tax=Treponema sp. TaxID=166 RepID=UPI00298DC655|nr:prephenate dehydrogenase [Treponema sp.]MCI5695753.1 prephenate dehydrogenase [Spirochaetia bacterium]MDD5811194.1 prephenate dehydrogenase [Treponema sp.]MDY5886189.1 prephenate dehydrogenase [Treponema sp.]